MTNSMQGGVVVPSTLKLDQQGGGGGGGGRPQTYTIQTPTNGGMKSIAVTQTFTPPKLEGLIQPRGGGGGGGGGGVGGIVGIGGTMMSEAGPIRNHSVGGGNNNSRHVTRDRPSPISVDGEMRSDVH